MNSFNSRENRPIENNNKLQGGKSRLLIGFVVGFVLTAILYYLASAWSINQEPVEDRYRRYKEEAKKKNEMSNNLKSEEVDDIRLYTELMQIP